MYISLYFGEDFLATMVVASKTVVANSMKATSRRIRRGDMIIYLGRLY
jgi:hypothetical protein